MIRKIFLMALIIILGCGALLTGSFYLKKEADRDAMIAKLDQQSVAELTADYQESITQYRQLIESVAGAMGADLASGNYAALQQTAGALTTRYGLVGVLFAEPDGSVYSAGGKLGFNAKDSRDAWFIEIIEKGQAFFRTSLYYGVISEQHIISMAVPIREFNRTIGVLIIDVAGTQLLKNEMEFILTTAEGLAFASDSEHSSWLGKNIYDEHPEFRAFSQEQTVFNNKDGHTISISKNQLADGSTLFTFIYLDELIEQLNQDLLFVFGGVFFTCLALCAALGYGLRKELGNLAPIKKWILAMSTGDIRKVTISRSNNELDEIVQSLETLNNRLGQFVQSTQSVTQTLSTEQTQITAVIKQSEGNAHKEIDALQQVSGASTELAQTAHEAANHALLAQQTANEAMSVINHSESTLARSEEITHTVNQTINEATQIVVSLREDSDKINSVVDVINSISDQINLLALNAAIEAARAGEHGRGFAVVADEVRALAAKTQQSTVNIQGIIQQLQAQSLKADESMTHNVRLVEESLTISKQLMDAFDSIRVKVESISELNTQAASASNTQRQVTDSISQQIDSIHQLVESNVVGVEQTSKVNQGISQLAKQLDQEIAFFKR